MAKKKQKEVPASVGSEKEKMLKIVKEQFSEIFLATTYATKNDRKNALYKCLDPGIRYTIQDLRRIFSEQYKFPISRVAINNYVNELEAEGKVKFTREGLGGSKIVSLPKQEQTVAQTPD
ncbi:MAG: hypothetical protein NWE89_16950 [Candidatus Bathyarchaeota archaeon]|nr:hypothetical protein [Candidatus Bathyarchaeota archaeon]